MAFSLTINNKPVKVDAEPDMPLLWVIRDLIGLKGTKFGCGIARSRRLHRDGQRQLDDWRRSGAATGIRCAITAAKR